MRRTMALGIVLGVCAAGAARAEQTLESVENEVEALWSKIGAFTAKITTDTTMSMALASVTAHGTGTIECAKQGDQTLFRLEVVNHTKMPVIGTVEQKLLTVYDGKVVINDMETQGMRNAFRMPHDTARKNGPAGGRSMFAGYRDQGEVKLLPDATVDGKPVWVVEVKPNEATKSGAPTPVALFRYSISKETGIQIKTEIFDDKGQPISTTVWSDIDLNAKPAPERFVYVAPPGVTIQEMPDFLLPRK